MVTVPQKTRGTFNNLHFHWYLGIGISCVKAAWDVVHLCTILNCALVRTGDLPCTCSIWTCPLCVEAQTSTVLPILRGSDLKQKKSPEKRREEEDDQVKKQIPFNVSS